MLIRPPVVVCSSRFPQRPRPGGVMRSFSLPACSSFAAGVAVSLCGVALIVAATGFRRWSGTEVAAPADPPAPRVEPHHPPAVAAALPPAPPPAPPLLFAITAPSAEPHLPPA